MRVFTPLAGLMLLASAVLLPAGLASAAGQGASLHRSQARPVLICATDAATRRAFMREHGAAPIFVTAREAMSVRISDPAWSTPRCMTAREYARYREAATTFAAVR